MVTKLFTYLNMFTKWANHNPTARKYCVIKALWNLILQFIIQLIL